MDEYTYENVIINPTSEESKNCLGKEVYYSNNPYECIKRANSNLKSAILKIIAAGEGEFTPFIVDSPDVPGGLSGYSCIIPKKKESKMEYIPFESTEEFIKRYIEVMKGVESDSIENNLLQCGMWLRFIEGEQVYQVLAMDKSGIFIVDRHITWKELLKYHSFLDGSPCGILNDKSSEV